MNTYIIKNNGKQDYSLIVQKALETCKAQNKNKIVFEPGVYDFYSDFLKERFFGISNNDSGENEYFLI